MKQWTLAENLLTSDKHIVIEADKNLGGCILDRETYIKQGLLEHIGNKDVYKKLTKTQASQKMQIVRYKINIFLSKYQDDLSPAEWHYCLFGLN